MDPRLLLVLKTLLSIAMEPTQAVSDPSQPPPDADNKPYPPGSAGHFWSQLEGPRQHTTWPLTPQVTDFGGP